MSLARLQISETHQCSYSRYAARQYVPSRLGEAFWEEEDRLICYVHHGLTHFLRCSSFSSWGDASVDGEDRSIRHGLTFSSILLIVLLRRFIGGWRGSSYFLYIRYDLTHFLRCSWLSFWGVLLVQRNHDLHPLSSSLGVHKWPANRSATSSHGS